jgi:hypothetical protein
MYGNFLLEKDKQNESNIINFAEKLTKFFAIHFVDDRTHQ